MSLDPVETNHSGEHIGNTSSHVLVVEPKDGTGEQPELRSLGPQ